jgi:hypothetical protein
MHLVLGSTIGRLQRGQGVGMATKLSWRESAGNGRSNFDELRASIKFSYAELDRRMTHLETVVSDLATRVVRLEHPPGG